MLVRFLVLELLFQALSRYSKILVYTCISTIFCSRTVILQLLVVQVVWFLLQFLCLRCMRVAPMFSSWVNFIKILNRSRNLKSLMGIYFFFFREVRFFQESQCFLCSLACITLFQSSVGYVFTIFKRCSRSIWYFLPFDFFCRASVIKLEHRLFSGLQPV